MRICDEYFVLLPILDVKAISVTLVSKKKQKKKLKKKQREAKGQISRKEPATVGAKLAEFHLL